MTDVTTLLAGIKTRAEKATEGPWEDKDCSPCTARGRLDVQIWADSGDVPIADWCDDDYLEAAK